MINPAAFIKAPLNFGKICRVYPPSVKEVLTISRFGQYKKLLTISQDELELELKNKIEKGQRIPTPLEFALANAYHSKEFFEIVKEAYEYFTHEEIQLLIEKKLIVFGTEEEVKQQLTNNLPLRAISEEDYFDFQNLVRMSCGEEPLKPPEPIDPNEDPRIRRIKEKARLRDAIKAKKGVAGKGISFDTCLIAICCMGIGITPLNIGEMSYAAIAPLMKMYQEKEKYDLDIKTILAGGDSKKIKPKYWIKNSD